MALLDGRTAAPNTQLKKAIKRHAELIAGTQE